jgi:hypothetical protein
MAADFSRKCAQLKTWLNGAEVGSMVGLQALPQDNWRSGVPNPHLYMREGNTDGTVREGNATRNIR